VRIFQRDPLYRDTLAYQVYVLMVSFLKTSKIVSKQRTSGLPFTERCDVPTTVQLTLNYRYATFQQRSI